MFPGYIHDIVYETLEFSPLPLPVLVTVTEREKSPFARATPYNVELAWRSKELKEAIMLIPSRRGPYIVDILSDELRSAFSTDFAVYSTAFDSSGYFYATLICSIDWNDSDIQLDVTHRYRVTASDLL